jgi:hypothetical protein
MSAAEIIKELPKLTEADRRELFGKLMELVQRDEEIAACNHSAAEGAAQVDRLEDAGSPYRVVDLRQRGVSEAQAADLRARLKTFAEDWDRPDASVYDEDPAR